MVVYETEELLIEAKQGGWYTYINKKTGSKKTQRLQKKEANQMLEEIG